MIVPRRRVDAAPGEFKSILQQQQISQSALIGQWEQTFSQYVGRKHGIAVGSGRLAMKLILASLNLPAGSEIIIPAYTLKDLLAIIESLDLKPVPADIDPRCWNITVETIRPRLTRKTRAVLVLHLFGVPAPMPEIISFADENDLMVVEDCAHSAGSTIHGRQTGSFGHAAFFSFEAIKPINTYGGGMVVTDDHNLAEQIREVAAALPPPVLGKKIKAVRLEGLLFASGLAFFPLALLATQGGQRLMTRIYRMIQHAPTVPNGYSDQQAALGLQRLDSLERRIAQRRRQAALLESLLPANCRSQQCLPETACNYYFFVIQAPGNINSLRRKLLLRGFDCGIGAEIADDCASLLGDNRCPEAKKLFTQAIHLPLHEGVEDRQLRRLADLLAKFSAAGSSSS